MLGENNPSKRLDVRLKISKSKIGNKNPMYGKPGTNLGKKFSDKHIKNISKNHADFRGENSGKSKFIKNDINEIINLYKEMWTIKMISKKYSVNYSTILKILSNKSYKNIERKPMINLYSKIENAPNFTFWEFIKSDTAIRLNIDNFPKEDYIWDNIRNLTINCLQPIRNYFQTPIKINSGYRCPLLNTAIGSSNISNHVYGLAVDIEPFYNDILLIDVLNWIYNNLEYKELIAEYFDKNGWIHIAYQKDNNKKVLKLKDRNHNYTRVSIDYINKIYK